jgi:hypothetical protein
MQGVWNMSIFKRIGEIVRSNRPEPPRTSINPYEDTKVGDIVSVGLNEYVVSGKVVYFDRGYPPHRYAYYLQDGAEISCLIVEKGRVYECFHCTFLEGGLDTPDDVPTHLEINGSTGYDLEHQRHDLTRTEGNTDFRTGDEVIVWKYFGNGDNSFYLLWQDGKFIALQGERTRNADIKFMKSG